MEEKQYTAQTFADKTGLTKESAYKFLAGCESVGFAKNIGKAPKAPGQKGHGANLYELDDDFKAKMLDLVEKIHA